MLEKGFGGSQRIKYDLIILEDGYSFEEFVEKVFCKNNGINSIEYLKEYFDRILRYLYHYTNYKDDSGHKIQTVLVEHPYFSESYINDYSEFYSKIFKEHERVASRIHFFTETFDENVFNKMMRNPNSKSYKKFWDSYIGYIVEKPLPNSIIGATLLEPYENIKSSREPSEEKVIRRYYNSLREYKVTIGAKELELNTLVFQQQDGAVSACATISLWVAINMLHKIFGCQLINPSDITELAGEKANSGRMFPNDGLEASQIVRVINKIGLVSEVLTTQKTLTFDDLEVYTNGSSILSNKVLRENIYAYNRLGIPLLLGYKVVDEIRGNHLTTVVGFKLKEGFEKKALKKVAKSEDQLILKSQLIERIYVHDDQLGPFSRIEFENEGRISTKWINNESKDSIAKVLIIPVKDEIRLKYEDVARLSKQLNELLTQILKSNLNMKDCVFCWDIYLQKSNDYKIEVLNNRSIDFTISDEILVTPFPKFIWVARVELINTKNEEDIPPILDFIFDSSEIGVGLNFFKLFFFDEDLKDELLNFTTEEAISLFKMNFKHNPAVVKKFAEYFNQYNLVDT